LSAFKKRIRTKSSILTQRQVRCRPNNFCGRKVRKGRTGLDRRILRASAQMRPQSLTFGCVKVVEIRLTAGIVGTET
jgi:hypothetical protein